MNLVFFVFCVLLYIKTSAIVSAENCGNALFLTPLIEKGEFEKARRSSRVRSDLFGCDTHSYSGLITVNKKYNSNLFFWFFKSKKHNVPVLLWLNGGPGTSSMVGLFSSNGPFNVTKELKLQCRHFSWTRKFSMLYIDSPVGVGFSFTNNSAGYANTTIDVARNLFNSLNQLSDMFPEIRNNDFYGAGESYAGKYLSSLGSMLHNTKKKFINFKGIAVGNAFIDPPSAIDFGPHLYQFGLIDRNQLKVFDRVTKEIRQLIRTGEFRAAAKRNDWLMMGKIFPSYFNNITGYKCPYDVRYTVDYRNYNPITDFLNKYRVRRSLHVGCARPYVIGWGGNRIVASAMMGDLQRSYKDEFVVLMNHYKVMVYSGNLDLLLSPNFFWKLNWKYRNEYLHSVRKIWKLRPDDTDVAGYIRKAHDFYEVTVRNAGHTVGSDKPEPVFHLITEFVNGKL